VYGKSTHGAHHAARVVVRIKLWREEGSKKWVSCESLKLLHGVKPRMCWPSQTSVLLSHCLAGKPSAVPVSADSESAESIRPPPAGRSTSLSTVGT